MLDEIKALMPLLEQVTGGAAWAFVVYMAYKIIIVMAWLVIGWFVVGKGHDLISKRIPASDVEVQYGIYEVEKGGHTLSYLGDQDVFYDLLAAACGNPDGYVHRYQLQDLLRKAKEKE